MLTFQVENKDFALGMLGKVRMIRFAEEPWRRGDPSDLSDDPDPCRCSERRFRRKTALTDATLRMSGRY